MYLEFTDEGGHVEVRGKFDNGRNVEDLMRVGAALYQFPRVSIVKDNSHGFTLHIHTLERAKSVENKFKTRMRKAFR